MSSSYQMYPSVVVKVDNITPIVKRFTFKRIDGECYPKFTAGSHVFVKMNDAYSNAYSLISSCTDSSYYQICVQKEESGKGGSVFMHERCVEGYELEVSSPNNLFELAKSGERHLLIAGGIGITPFISQMEELEKANKEYELHFACRTPEYLSLLGDIQSSAKAGKFHTYISSENSYLDLDLLISKQPLGTHIYVCGPKSMIEATIEACHKCLHSDENIHWEQFSSSAIEDGEAFTVFLANSNISVKVNHDQTILQAIESFNINVECLCREGVCGTCETEILEGEAEHLDQYLDDDEKCAQKTMMICVSRAKGSQITLAL